MRFESTLALKSTFVRASDNIDASYVNLKYD